jgi:2-polyprenyl-3-methyl-5-hydroxy-6-metoxy-1,4-benzoquinol methylase
VTNATDASTSIFWNILTGKYSKATQQSDESYDIIIRKIVSYSTKKSVVADILCGSGKISIKLAPEVHHITAIENSTTLIEICKTKASERSINSVNFKTGTIDDLKNDRYDIIFISNQLIFSTDLHSIIQKSKQLLNPGGYIITTVDCLSEPPSLESPFLAHLLKFLSLLGLVTKIHYFSKESFIDFMTSQSLKVIENSIVSSFPVHMFSVFQKA